MSNTDSSPIQKPSRLRRVFRLLFPVVGALAVCGAVFAWFKILKNNLQISTAAEETGLVLVNVLALVFAVWLGARAMRGIIGCPSLTRWFLSWRIQRRALVCLAGFVTVVAMFYTVENWRGRRAWEQCKRELESKGEKLDWEAFIPPPIPDEQNFFKAPGMAAWFSRQARETNQNVRIYSVPPAMALVASTRGTLDGLRSLPEKPAGNDAAASAGSRAALRAAFDEREPEYRLLAEACARPKSRLADDYTEPFAMDIPSFVNARTVAQTLSVHAGLSLLDGRPEVAAQDLSMMRRTGAVMDDGHTLVGTMINTAIQGLYVQTARDALEAGLWPELQLAALQQQTRDVDLPASFASAMRGAERAGVVRVLEGSPRELAKIFTAAHNQGGSNEPRGLDWPALLTRIKLELCPRGWILQNQAMLARSQQEFLDSCDVTGRRLHAAQLNALNDRLQALASHVTPYTFFRAVATPNFIRAVQTLARYQTQLDQLHVACALQRFRLAHGSYPEKLDALMPALLDHVPKDLFADRPLQYRRDEKGGFLLWSAGWDEKDDGGVPHLDKDGKPAYDASPGDWVWQSRQP